MPGFFMKSQKLFSYFFLVFYDIFSISMPGGHVSPLFRLISYMKHLFSVLLLIFFALPCFPQDSGLRMIIKGLVVDSVTQRSAAYVTVSLFTSSDDKPRKVSNTDVKGQFEFSQIPVEEYSMVFSLVGYRPLKLSVRRSALNASGIVNLGRISLAPLTNELQSVNISGVKPLVVQQADRLSYDVQADPDSRTNNVLDMLRKVPLVSVDGADRVRLKGSTNYRMLINGKTSSLVSNNPADLLKAMPADNIERIEVITTPPAKYDAEGISGIINIITHRKLGEGYSVSVTSTYNTVNGPSGNINAKARTGKFGVQGFIGTAQPVQQTVATGYMNSITGARASELMQQGTMVHDRDNTFGSAQFSFQADSLNLITAEFEHHEGGSEQQLQQVSRYTDQQRLLSRAYELGSITSNKLSGTDVSLNHEHSFRRAKGQLLTSSYKYSYSRDAFSNDATYGNTQNFAASDFWQQNKSGSREHTAQIDYLHPAGPLEIEAGVKAILRNNFSEFDTGNLNRFSRIYNSDPGQATDFDYQQDIYSLYNSYHLIWRKWDIRAGLRLEASSVEADFSTADDQISQRYTNLFPSVSVQRTVWGSNSLSMGYQQRMERPGIILLNPFEDYTNPGFLRSGNPDLRAVLNHSFDLMYSNYSSNPITVGLSYAFANNTIEQITQVGEDRVSRTTHQNTGRRGATSLIVNANYSITSRLNTNIDAQLMYVTLDGFVDGSAYANDGVQGHIFSNARYRLERGYRLGLDISYDSRYVLLQGRDNDFLYYSINGSKDFLNEKATISVSTSNFFDKYARLDFTTRGNGFRQRHFYDIYYRRFNVRLIYRFGRLKDGIKTNRRGIRNDDQSTGRSNPT